MVLPYRLRMGERSDLQGLKPRRKRRETPRDVLLEGTTYKVQIGGASATRIADGAAQIVHNMRSRRVISFAHESRFGMTQGI
jgi:hypothetical protein